MRYQAPMHIGILGGGQLARMLCEAAIRAGHHATVSSASRPTSAAIEGVNIVNHPDDERALDALIEQGAQYVTIENEFLDIEQLERCLARNPAINFFPTPQSIVVAQDKLRQKKLFSKLSIPSAAFERLGSTATAQTALAIRKHFKRGTMLKWSRFGYDGKGNLPLPSASQLDSSQAKEENIETFLQQACDRGADVYAEEMIDFEHELAMVATRSARGRFIHFPLVYSVQKQSVCCEVFGPCVRFGLDAALERQASDMLHAIAEELAFVGTFAVEFFLDRHGKLLANEMAPRVHNSGHYSLYDTEQSQFDAHIQALTGQSIRQPDVRGFFLMRNFLGPDGSDRKVPCPAPQKAPPPNSEVYWYDKGGASKGRKMGHMTGRARTVEELTLLRRRFTEYEAQYWAQLKNNAM